MSAQLKALPKLPPTAYSKQPWKFMYIFYSLTSTIALLPFWTLLHFSPFNTFPAIWTLRETVQIRAMRRLSYILAKCDIPLGMRSSKKLPDKGSLKESRAFFIEGAEERFIKGILKSDFVTSTRIPAYIYGRERKEEGEMKSNEGEGGLKLEQDEKVLLYFHGGGLAVGTANESDLTANIPKEIVKRSKYVKQGISIEYRLVHQTPFPGQIIDALSGYLYLTETLGISSSNIVMAGDSAGGSLCLSLIRYLRDEGFKLPRALLLCSPWCDMTNDISPKFLMHQPLNFDIDFLNFAALQPWISHRLLLNNPISIIDSPYLSPAATSLPATPELFKGFPQTFITSGGAESLIEQIRELVRRFEISGVDFEYDEQKDAVHDYMIADWFQPVMRERIWVKTTLWIDSLFK